MFKTLLLMMLAASLLACSDKKTEIDSVENKSPNSIVGNTKQHEQTFDRESAFDALPVGTVKVEIHELSMPTRAVELMNRMENAIKLNPQWWMRHVQDAEPGKPLAYDEKLGLTKDEYEEMLVLSEIQTTYIVDTATIHVTENTDGTYAIDGGEKLPELSSITFDFVQDNVNTRFGVMDKKSSINAKSGSPLGAWIGTQWKYEYVVDPFEQSLTGTVAKLAIGKRTKDDRHIIYYDVKHLTPDVKDIFTYVLVYDMPSEN